MAPQGAAACSAQWLPGYSPEDIKDRSDVRMIRGTFRVEEFVGEPLGDDPELGPIFRDGKFLGNIESRSGANWSTIHDAPLATTLTCYRYLKPTQDASGTFWISRRREDGRFELLLWEGEYVQVAAEDAGEATE
jgi:hypothetical protein